MLRQYYDGQIKWIEKEISEIDRNIIELQKQIDRNSSEKNVSFSPRNHGNDESENIEDDLKVIRWKEKIRAAELRKETLVHDLDQIKEKIENEELQYDDELPDDNIEEESSSDGILLGEDSGDSNSSNNNYIEENSMSSVDENKAAVENEDHIIISEFSSFIKEELVKINTVMTIFSSNRNKAKTLLKEIKNDLETKARKLDS